MGKLTLHQIKSALQQTPEELDSMYDHVFDCIRNQDPDFAALALKLIYWTHYATRPLNVQELRDAAAVEAGETSFKKGLPDEDLIEST
ncbi:MAG: hypothetical protein L6R36_009562, partial [Xanthoria steineri]